MKPFPVAVVAFGPGSQAEDTDLEYLTMPQGMHTYHAPILPEPEEVISLKEAHAVFHLVLEELLKAIAGQPVSPIDLSILSKDNLKLINQVLGEGEVSAKLEGDTSFTIQEAVFAGIWRVVERKDGQVISDRIEVGAIPEVLHRQILPAGKAPVIAIPATLPPGVMNAPSILTELNDQLASWKVGMLAHVVNLTLLPLSEEDVKFLGDQLGDGNAVILSRGYGNCRISSTGIPNCWQLVYFNSQDNVILHTIEIVHIPEVACAAIEDLEDSHERLTEVLEWVEGK